MTLEQQIEQLKETIEKSPMDFLGSKEEFEKEQELINEARRITQHND